MIARCGQGCSMSIVAPYRFCTNSSCASIRAKFASHAFLQIGTVVEGPTEFYSGRLTKSERKPSLTAELLADDKLKSYRSALFDLCHILSVDFFQNLSNELLRR